MTGDEQQAAVRRAALAFVLEEAGFAQLTTIDRLGFPVGRSMTAFLNPDWSVDLVQRRTHARLAQLRRDPRLLVTWVGDPAPGATNERPHVFDIGRLPPRAVYVRGTAAFLDDAATISLYRHHVGRQRAQGFTKAPLRSPEQVVEDLVGVHVTPYRIRLEGFGAGAQAFDWTHPDAPSSPADAVRPIQGET
ncbi:pyridoxamine 5'-phosphate oxidase family protein [Blastococcus sp. BMG 814]|uniref:Pyridoxamine 5'-phosphate oxidase family protein n=1 Tax=Blastococcus carthaginiensis TaxID=3050034 RepID=A0ABT9I6L7_9ACTN|nr:pyridoxamine 5'-phosphate oxidase family protein [Blastococcus carthaginiensis]MDP5181220.1 pyridoxamine 5'-phosphate oxidase family protein [Blastococcus carthaginiensis]